MAIDSDGGSTGAHSKSASSKTAFFNDPKVRSTVIQVVLVTVLVYAVWSLISNTATNHLPDYRLGQSSRKHCGLRQTTCC